MMVGGVWGAGMVASGWCTLSRYCFILSLLDVDARTCQRLTSYTNAPGPDRHHRRRSRGPSGKDPRASPAVRGKNLVFLIWSRPQESVHACPVQGPRQAPHPPAAPPSASSSAAASGSLRALAITRTAEEIY